MQVILRGNELYFLENVQALILLVTFNLFWICCCEQFNTCNAVIRTHLRVLGPELKVIKYLLLFMPSPLFVRTSNDKFNLSS
jgi:hypothetical protein